MTRCRHWNVCFKLVKLASSFLGSETDYIGRDSTSVRQHRYGRKLFRYAATVSLYNPSNVPLLKFLIRRYTVSTVKGLVWRWSAQLTRHGSCNFIHDLKNLVVVIGTVVAWLNSQQFRRSHSKAKTADITKSDVIGYSATFICQYELFLRL